MKTLRRVLIALVAPALLLLGLTQIGGTPISKGYNVRFNARIETKPKVAMILSTDSGDLVCWLKLRIPATFSTLSASLSNGTPLGVYQDSREGSSQWIAVVADAQKREEKFKWPSGATVVVYSSDPNPPNLVLTDWRVFLTDKDYDSKGRATWRTIVFSVFLGLLGLAVIGGVLEGYSKLTEESPPLTPQRCVEFLIASTTGTTSKETKWRRAILRDVLLEAVPVADTLKRIRLKEVEKMALWFSTRRQFVNRLEILELIRK
jgi:hypothetical protein